MTDRVFAYGFSLRKRAVLRRFAGGAEVQFIKNGSEVPAGATLLLWGSGDPPEGLDASVAITRVEDGFIRSVGLGAELTRPLSWVMDGRGIYYDATRPSDLEHLLQTHVFSPETLARAARLRQRIVTGGITKYCVGSERWRRPSGKPHVILIPGQVETDASIRYGAPGIRRNVDLVSAVREANPDSYLLYKPHPDVSSGLRSRGIGEREVYRHCDEVVTDVAMGDLLSDVDEVHVLTSLAGFEALLRGKAVVCYGQPFYAGWGLTRDQIPMPRRRRRLSLDELVAGALTEYPIYVSRVTGRRISPESALDELMAWRDSQAEPAPIWQFMRRALLRLTVSRP